MNGRLDAGTEAKVDALAPEPAARLAGLLDRPEVDRGSESTLPPLWHWVYFLDTPVQSDLGPDGHPLTATPAPPRPGLRRMFAGGRVTHHGLLTLGVPAEMRTEVVSQSEKKGRSGPLWFVTVRQHIEQDGRLVITEERDIVYREPAPVAQRDIDLTQARTMAELADARAVPGGGGLDLRVDPTFLFRFSALTYNAHRIHYDLAWCAYEGYSGLVVHGPLQALAMGELLRKNGSSFTGRTFAYRLQRPMIGAQVLRVRRDGSRSATDSESVCVYDTDAEVTATATLG